MTDIKDLTARIIAFRDARDWKQFHNPKDVSISLMLEAGEVMEHFQWKNKKEIVTHILGHKEDIADELADVLNLLMILAHDLNIDLSIAVKNKLKKAEIRYPIDQAKGKHTKYTQLT